MRNLTIPNPSRPAPTASLPGGPARGGDEPSAGAARQAATTSEAILKNRRAWDRHQPEDDLILVGWWSGDDFLIVGARMVNIGRGGLMISIAATPAAGQPVWLRMSGSRGTESLKAIVLDAKSSLFQRRSIVRLAFPRTCPDEFFDAAVHGRSSVDKD